MRGETAARRLLSFPRLSVGKVRFESDALGSETLVIEVAVRGRSRCSRCGRKCPGYDRLRPRRWWHLDFGAWEVQLEATLCRVECSRCGVVFEQVSWAAPDSRFTLHFEDYVGWLAQRCDKTAISTMLRIAWRSVGTILERVVERHRAPIDWTKVKAIATDELSFRKGHHYLTLVSDLETGRILWSKEGRSAATLEAFFAEIGTEACARIQHAAIDMFEGYAQAIRRCLPNATIIFDRFHVQ
jgi:transposase